MSSYSMDLRNRVVEACDRREGTREEIAQRFRVSIAWVYRLLQRRRHTGSIAPKAHSGGRSPALNAKNEQRLSDEVQRRPDATLEELRDALGFDCSLSAVQRSLGKLGLRRKKSRLAPPSRTVRS